jgi:HemY protein
MIRVILFLVLVGLLAVGAAWMADRPGEVTIVWLGRHIDTSVMVAAAAIALVAALAVVLWSIVRAVLRSPRMLSRAMRDRRRARASRAISRGLIAIGAGDTGAARKFATQADRLAPSEPLALLLSAQTAQLTGDRPAADRAFRAMAARQDTRLLGLRGLYVEAHRRNDATAARHYAEQAARAAPALPWAGQAVLEYRCAAGDWAGALAALDTSRRADRIDRAAYRRQRAVLLAARALADADTNAAAATAAALEAVKLAPDLVPAAALAGRLAAEAGELRKAARLLERAWRAHPHPDIADVYAHLRSGDSARDRLARVQSLTRQPAGHPEGVLAVARVALEARDFVTARRVLAPLTATPTRRVALMMAELEEAEHGDVGRAREWMARALRAPRDRAWTADGFVSDHWMPVSPVTGRLDAFRWERPVTLDEGRLIESHERPDAAGAAPVSERDRLGRNGKDPGAHRESPPAAAGPRSAPPRSSGQQGAPRQVVQAVIPLVHAPDDPGPPELEREPAVAGAGRKWLFFW